VGAFPGTDAFQGPWVGREAAGLSLAGQATFDGGIVLSSRPRPQVERLLPAELELAESSTPEAHPLVFIFGDLTQGATIFGGITWPLGVSYREFALAVPLVRRRGDPHLHTFVPRMYSSYFPATWNGNVFYGLGKEMAEMGWRERTFAIRSERGEALLHADLGAEGPWIRASDGGPDGFEATCALFRLPILGLKAGGRYVRSYFDWDLSQARARAVAPRVHVDAPIAEGVAPGRYPGAPGGSFEVQRMDWRLSYPEPLAT
jgi:hypothetical protein